MSIVDRLDLVRLKEGLNKSQFEKKLSKSTGYLNMLVKRESNPGADVLAVFSKSFPNYCLEWLITGEGEMLKNQDHEEAIAKETTPNYQNATLQSVHQDLKQDLSLIAEGMTINFEKVAGALFESLKGQQKILKFISKLDPDKINNATGKLDEFLEVNKK